MQSAQKLIRNFVQITNRQTPNTMVYYYCQEGREQKLTEYKELIPTAEWRTEIWKGGTVGTPLEKMCTIFSRPLDNIHIL